MKNPGRVKMKTRIIMAAALAAALAATPLLASSSQRAENNTGNHDKYYGSGQVEWMSQKEAAQKAREHGYRVSRIKRHDGYYEVYGYDKNGMMVELYLHPTTGKIVKLERKF
jgi:hypothetical protein